MCILAHILTEAMLTAMTSLYVAPCESGPPLFLITLIWYWVTQVRVVTGYQYPGKSSDWVSTQVRVVTTLGYTGKSNDWERDCRNKGSN